ncbi:hypothetical protein CKO25_10410 [Thiocapsa imhoffii]|uniref:Undecaprenyl-phosphate alpha-N-acetylglucosaminyl 1-phosphate transferase n=1 Tax=Thiocapsa imhoffii TaxID=382777 RepID=A0A9X0WHX3_9GAMM|nr:hypothetical protein [Thiocapsa imhoffii]
MPLRFEADLQTDHVLVKPRTTGSDGGVGPTDGPPTICLTPRDWGVSLIIAALCIITASVISAWSLVLLYPLAKRIGLVDLPNDRRKFHTDGVPPIGGLSIFFGLAVASLVVFPIQPVYLWGLAGAALLVIVGALDDRFSCRTSVRFATEITAALLLTLGSGVTLTSLGDLFGFGTISLGPFAVPLTVFAMVGIINAVNMMDGIDGLAGSLVAIALMVLVLLAPTFGPVQLMGLATIAALVPVLIRNLGLFGASRKVFLGDSGSLLLGYILVWSLVEASEPRGTIAPVTALWLVAIPLMDTLRVIGRRLLRGASPFKADDEHLHHILTRLVQNPRQTLIVVLLLSIALTGVGLFGHFSNLDESVIFYAALLTFVCYLALTYLAGRLSRCLNQQSDTGPPTVRGDSKMETMKRYADPLTPVKRPSFP